MIWDGKRLSGPTKDVVAEIAIPFEAWPLWAKAFAQFRRSEDKGVGDIVQRLIGNENSDKFKQWFESTFQKPCDCNGRQQRWNRMFPLNE